MLRKVVVLLVVLALSLTAVGVVSADEGKTSTSILVQNLTAGQNQVTLNFYQTSGTMTPGTKTYTLGSEASTTFDQRQASGDPGMDPFQGAAVLSAQAAVGAVVQIVRTGGSSGVNSYEAYNGLGDTSIAQLVKAPLLMRNIASGGKTWNTMMSIQNTSLSAAAAVTVTYATTPTPFVAHYTIPAGGTQYIKHADEAGLGASFFGAATITANQNVGVVVLLGSSDGALLAGYPTYTTGATSVFLPGAFKNVPSQGDNYWSSCTIVNMGTSQVTVKIEYQAKSGTVNAAGRNVTVDKSTTIDLRSDPLITSNSFFGAIKLTVVGSGSIAAMLNSRGDSAAGSRFLSTYSGFSGGMTTVFTPYLLKLIQSAGYSWSTSILIQNLDPSSPLTVNISYKDSRTNATFTSQKANITSFDSVDLRNDTNISAATFYGGAKLTSVGNHPFGIAVLVRGSGGAGDALSSYLGISQ